MTDDLVARWDCVSATWTPHQRLHPGHVAWSHSRGDGSPAPDAILAWGEPLAGFADVWHDGYRPKRLQRSGHGSCRN